MVRQMKVVLCSLVLNEEEFIERNYEQHKDWPGLVSWIFVEGADPLYAQANPRMVTKHGLSIDRTSSILDKLYLQDKRLTVNQCGWMKSDNPAQAKAIGRDRYLQYLEDINPDIFVVIDADEFYTRTDQHRINHLVAETDFLSYRFRQRHLWKPPYLQYPDVFNHEVRGGYWDVPHVRVFRWRRGIRYTKDHNYPQGPGYHPLRKLYEGKHGDPECIHLGFARFGELRKATNSYYQQRGEGESRKMYVECRAAWETWRPDKQLPHGARIMPYTGPVPEVYQ